MANLAIVDAISQVIIFVVGLIAIFLISGLKNRWGNVAGLACQPCWYFTTWYHQQGGLLALSFVYTLVWCFGIYQWFFKNGGQEQVK